MAQPNLTERDPLDDFERRPVTLLGQTKLVVIAGSGPAVIVMTELPGSSSKVACLAAAGSMPSDTLVMRPR